MGSKRRGRGRRGRERGERREEVREGRGNEEREERSIVSNTARQCGGGCLCVRETGERARARERAKRREETHISAVAVTEPVNPKMTVMPGRKMAPAVVIPTKIIDSPMRMYVSFHVAGAVGNEELPPPPFFPCCRPSSRGEERPEGTPPLSRPIDSYREPNSLLSSFPSSMLPVTPARA